MIKSIKNYKSIICLDGELPIEFLKNMELPIFAADGAANALIKNNINPEVIIGDLDSVDISILKKFKYKKDEDQDSTDFEKALHYVNDLNLCPAIITGISGGYIDRIFMNLNIVTQSKSAIFTKGLFGFPSDRNCNLNLSINTKISIFGAPYCKVTSNGLKWELKNTTLAFGEFCSCSNRVIKTNISLQIEGTALIFIYLDEIEDAGQVDNNLN